MDEYVISFDDSIVKKAIGNLKLDHYVLNTTFDKMYMTLLALYIL